MELYHFGVPGTKWGVRRYQSLSGGLSVKGKKRLEKLNNKVYKREKKVEKAYQKRLKRSNPLVRTSISDARYQNSLRKYDKAKRKLDKSKKKVSNFLSKYGNQNYEDYIKTLNVNKIKGLTTIRF